MNVKTMVNQAKDEKEKQDKEVQTRVFEVLKRAFTTVVSDEDGVIALRFIMEQSGWDSDLIVGNPETGDIHDRATMYNNARRILYRQIRKFIPVQALKRIEFEKTNYKGEIGNE